MKDLITIDFIVLLILGILITIGGGFYFNKWVYKNPIHGFLLGAAISCFGILLIAISLSVLT